MPLFMFSISHYYPLSIHHTTWMVNATSNTHFLLFSAVLSAIKAPWWSPASPSPTVLQHYFFSPLCC